ncbi:putative GDP dissociation inhibitor, FAD/NAD(P)-binding domain superfamily [Helianthus annuus]|nr:putative GDP dissociation inhibitor, FAD/NAD(P)-binding domain superfamily [Helianthus annuus]
MAETEPYPPIDPTNFDLIVIGTGLPESIIAAAASTAGKSVLHLDPNPHYGSHYSSLSLLDLTSFLNSQTLNPQNSGTEDAPDHTTAVNVITRTIYSDIEISCYDDSVTEHSRKLNLDVAGPRVLFCADAAVDLLLKSSANQYVEFKNIDASYVCDGNGELGHLEAVRAGDSGGDDGRIVSDEDLDSPFGVFLEKMKLPPKIKSIILYAIAMVDYDQDAGESCKDVLSTRDGIARLALYHSSVGRFPNALGALIYPLYGQGELPQAFCRRAAVKGCLYVLRMPVISFLLNKDSGDYKGVKLISGQEITSNKLVVDPSFILTSSPSESVHDVSKVFDAGGVGGKLARCICITKGSIKPDTSSCLVIYPPRSLYPDQATSIRVLQLGSSLGVCPSGMFVFYVSAVCDNALEGKKALHAVIDSLFSVHTSGTAESSSTDQIESTEVKPTLLWSALYMQDVIEGSMGPVVMTPTPDGNLNYNGLLHTTSKLFRKLYPDDEFFPETSNIETSEKLEDDSELA